MTPDAAPDRATLFDQVARLGKALASPKRLELIELLCQGEKSVEALAREAGIGVKLASAHLKALRDAQLITARRDGRFVHHRLASDSVAALWVALRDEACARLAELRTGLGTLLDADATLHGVDAAALLRRAEAGEVVVLDVRAADEYAAGHLPHARSMPMAQLRRRVSGLSKDVPVVAYCRGPFCVMARDAAALLRRRGYQAVHLPDGVAEWRARGLPLAT